MLATLLENIALIIAVAAPALVLVLIRTNTAVVFLSLCAGAVLVRFVGDEANVAATVMGNNSQAATQYAELALLLLPVLLSAFLLRKTVAASKTFINILPAIATGLVGVLLAIPLLPGNVQTAITGTEGWRLLESYQQMVVGVSVLGSLAALWLAKPGHQGVGKKHR